jgi:excinuclease ABC subunit A
MVELLFLPSVYTPCPDCHGSRYKASTLEITWRDRNIAEILQMSVEQAREFFDGDCEVLRSLTVLCDVGLGYLRLGQPATELSGGEAQRVKLASELQRAHRGDALYLLDEPTAGLHSADTDRLMLHLQKLVDVGNTVVIVELDMRVVARADYVIDLGPGAGGAGGRIVATGTPAAMSTNTDSLTAPYLAAAVDRPPRRKAWTQGMKEDADPIVEILMPVTVACRPATVTESRGQTADSASSRMSSACLVSSGLTLHGGTMWKRL